MGVWGPGRQRTPTLPYAHSPTLPTAEQLPAAAELILKHRPLLWGSEECLLDGRPLRFGRDYTLDYDTGILRLTARFSPSSVLHVRYRPQPFAAAPEPGAALEPFENGAPRALLPGLSLAADRPLVPPQEAGVPEMDRLREQLTSGLRLTEFNQRMDEPGQGTARVDYYRADALDPRTAGDAREEVRTELNLRPTPTSRLLFTDFFSRESLFSESYEQSERRRLQLAQTWGKSTAALMWERRRSDGYGVANALDALSLALAHPFTSSTSAEAFFAHENSLGLGRDSRSYVTLRQALGSAFEAQASAQYRISEFSGSAFETGLSLLGRPSSAADLSVDYRQSDSERYGRYSRASADLSASLGSRFELLGELSRRSSDLLGTVDTMGLGMAARPTARTLLEAAFSQSMGETLGRDRTHTLRLSADPSAAFKVNLGYDLLDSDREGRSQNALWMVALGGQRGARFEGYSGTHEIGGDDLLFSDSLYRLELRPLTRLSLFGSLRTVREEEERRAVAGVGAAMRLLSSLDVSAGYRRPTEPVPGEPDLYGHDVRVTLSPLAGLRLFGQQSVRPEDARGFLLDQTNRTYGLETRLGSLSLLGSYTSMEGSVSPDPGERLDLLATLALGPGTRVYGGIRTYEGLQVDEPRSHVYRLGLSQTAGPSLFMLLEGQFGWSESGARARTWDPDEMRAQARVGLRF